MFPYVATSSAENYRVLPPSPFGLPSIALAVRREVIRGGGGEGGSIETSRNSLNLTGLSDSGEVAMASSRASLLFLAI